MTWTGKPSRDVLERLLGVLPTSDPSVVVGPGYGEDAGVVLVDGVSLVVHSNPITAASKLAGWLAVHVAANDVAVEGGAPKWALLVVLAPTGSSDEELLELFKQASQACRELRITVIGGHTERTPGLKHPIVVATVMGVQVGPHLTPTSGVKPGDVIVMTKTAGLEGTAVIATDYERELRVLGVDEEVIEKAKAFMNSVSVVKEALVLARLGLANAMHDPTEGGILGGIAELAYASKTKIIVYEDQIPVADETKTICGRLGIDPLKLLGSGALLAAIPPENVDEALRELEKLGVKPTVIGEAEEGYGAYIVRRSGVREKIPASIAEEIYRVELVVREEVKKMRKTLG